MIGSILTMIQDSEDIAEYIVNNYKNKVVEIGVGKRPEVALALQEKLDVVITDVTEQKYTGLKFCRDDIFNPDLKIYARANLIYSIRPPIEMQEAMAKIGKEVGADLLIRPFGNEKADLSCYYRSCELVNYKKARFYLCRHGI
jgi:uncharacterized UPF0146 family protein